MSVSFGFKKKIENKVVATEKNEKTDGDDEPDYLKTIESKVLKSVKEKPEKKELIIPLIQKNRYNKVAPPKAKLPKDDKPSSDKPEDSLQDEAIKEIITESKNFLETAEAQNGEEFENLAVPLLLKNKVPDGFETDERLDVSLRPDEPSNAEYDQIPIAAFGMAVLRGMGWDPDEGIGKTFKQNTKMLEQQVRPKGLGLGADVPAAMKKGKPGEKVTQSQNMTEDALTLKKGVHILIEKGSLKNKYGTVLGIDIETARCIVKLAIGGKSEQVGQHCLKTVSKKEYDKNAKDLSRLSKAYTGENTYVIGNGKHEHKREDSELQGHSKKHHDKPHRSQEKEVAESQRHHRSHEKSSEKKHKRKHKYEQTSDDDDEVVKQKKTKKETFVRTSSDEKKSHHKKHKKDKKHKNTHKEKPQPPTLTWVRPHMRVRIIDKSYKKGGHFREKVIVEDVLAKGMCSCRTDDGKILDEIHDSMLETVIPKSSSDAYVIIVQTGRSEHNGKMAKILEKNKNKSQALLQLIEDRGVVVKVSFEEMCEYTGDVEAHAMF